ncbi:hypothetical protein T11_11975 [Trichinella zimbabwensis]|uniref:Uncharacterized protein n=1 Tax=Trichinella zimbabwensis TaxID=268475 RepID=A0A0V1GG19_9BILA|nr:hypothetical protein T11_11975 [Trichinella zimbabwensis]
MSPLDYFNNFFNKIINVLCQNKGVMQIRIVPANKNYPK